MSIQEEKTENTENVIKDDNKLSLRLSDVIRIESPNNKVLNDNIFVIDFLNSTKIGLINLNDLTETKIRINDDGSLSDGSIKTIAILDRNKELGYARQHNLLPDTWISIYFGGDIPAVLTAKITNLENDMIELKTYPNDTFMYIDFGYEGIPEDLPIELIEIREKPEGVVNMEESIASLPTQLEAEENISTVAHDMDMDMDMDMSEGISDDDGNNNDVSPGQELEQIQQNLTDMIISSDEIIFGDKMSPITQQVNVDKSKQRYDILSQTNDLLDEIISKIPDNKRTLTVMNNIHTMIERFKQLRTTFSRFDDYGNVISVITKGNNWKPLVSNLLTFQKSLSWILPVAKNIKKIYDTSPSENLDDVKDVISQNTLDNIGEMETIIDRYKSNNGPNDINRYDILLEDLNPYFTPFNDIDIENEKTDYIDTIVIEDNLDVIIDNLGEFYSSIVDNSNVKSTRFVIGRYNLGTKRNAIEKCPGQSGIISSINITPPDELTLQSIVMMPEPFMRYSQVELPATSIYDKANISYNALQYWRVLNKKTNVNNIFVDDFEKDIDFVEEHFGKDIKNFVLNQHSTSLNIENSSIYRKYLETIIPNTRVLFSLMKKYITGKLSVYDTVGYLEPFLVYTDDLTYMQYKEIVYFLQDRISKYNIRFKERSRSINSLKNIKGGVEASYKQLMNVINDHDVSRDVQEKYNSYEMKLTNSEMLWKMKTTDYADVYDASVAVSNVKLMLPESINSIIDKLEEEQRLTKKDLSDKEKDNTCKNIIVAKQYQNKDDMTEENDKVIFFDKKYDDTPYSILDNYEKQEQNMGTEEFYEFLTNELTNKYKYGPSIAPYMSTNLINKYKTVREGDYAIFFDTGEERLSYFKRTNGKWKEDREIDKLNINNEDMFCNLQKDCIEIEDKYNKICESYDMNKKELTGNALKEMIHQFDNNYEMSRDALLKKLKANIIYRQNVFDKLTQIQISSAEKYNNFKYRYGLTATETYNVISPHARKLNAVLGQDNQSKRQRDIIQFAIQYTREANISSLSQQPSENINWRYCINTGVPLMPTFLYTLAVAYIETPNEYDAKMAQIIKTNGALSDDNEGNWVDQFSGWVIKPRDFDTEEGFDESGFKTISREVMEQDAGDALLSAKEITISYSNPENKMMYNIVSSLSGFMGINMNDQMEFIIKIAGTVLREGALPNEEEYKVYVKERSKKGKKVVEYDTLYNSTLLYLTLGAFLIGIQTSVPPVKTRTTFPGCVRSFTGYPFEGTGDFAGLKYLTCIAFKMRKETIIPWNALMRQKEPVIEEKIKQHIDKYYLDMSEVKRRFGEKIEYMMSNPGNDIPAEYELNKWTTFLPPLIPFKLKTLENISDEFKSSLLSQLKSGSVGQREKMSVVLSKIIYFSLGVQEQIQKVLNKKKWLLSNSSNEPFLENACCNTGPGEKVIQYFIHEDNIIQSYLKTTDYLSEIMQDIRVITRAPVLYCRENSKNVYGSLSDEYSEQTIYKAFIDFCHFNTLLPIQEDLRAVCVEKPERFSKYDNISVQIRKLKEEGCQYSNESFLRLLQIVNRNHILHIDTSDYGFSIIHQLRQQIKQLKARECVENMETGLIAKMDTLMDTYDIAVNSDMGDRAEMRDMKNYLAIRNTELKDELIPFLLKYGQLSKVKMNNLVAFLNNLTNWGHGDVNGMNMSEDTMFNLIQFVKNSAVDMVKVFPYIILNKVDYDDIIIPKHYGLSDYDKTDITTKVREYYMKLRSHYNNGLLRNVLNTIHDKHNILLEMILGTPYLSAIEYRGENKHSIFDKTTVKLLIENYMLLILNAYKKLGEDRKMLYDTTEDIDVDPTAGLQEEVEVDNITTTDEIDDTETHVFTGMEREVQAGNLKELNQNVASLLVTFLEIMKEHKSIVDPNYEEIMDMVFNSKETEKKTFTDRLKALSDEERNADTILKINKLGVWNKGLQKGLTSYVKDIADDEISNMNRLVEMENIVRMNKGVTDNNVNQYMEDTLERQDDIMEIEREVNNIAGYLGDDADGDYFGQEEENWEQYD